VRWTAERYEELQAQQQKLVEQLRAGAQPFRCHTRLPTTLAELQCAWEIWLRFAEEAGAIGAVKQEELGRRTTNALAELSAIQPAYQIAGDPASQFIAHLRAALASGVAHVKNRFGETPDTPFKWGWRLSPNDRKWVAQGMCIGWVTDSDVYLDPSASDRVVREATDGKRLDASGHRDRRWHCAVQSPLSLAVEERSHGKNA
jgi:hypothetical protein